ncbi:putative LAGLIDADG/HNH homing endonuclease protein [Rhizobium phage RHph_N3_13]|nr:putative LAGLIDADG/HNH homing endonuclease protein [Rhizobium phage RHph_N3_13]QIG73068.1 putative LAGLIDADG/HNH homing endonuclease protein [Rhizobium phage RHph_N3_19]
MENLELVEGIERSPFLSEKESWIWAAGILEGEGCFSLNKKKDRLNTYISAIHCEMTDEDVIKSLFEIFKVGNYYPIKKRADDIIRKPSWRWTVYKQADVFGVLMKISPYMHSRRKEKISHLIEHLEGRILGS